MLKFGYHIKDINKKYDIAIKNAHELKTPSNTPFNSFQIFLKSPMKITLELNIDEQVINKTKEYVVSNNIFLVVHSIHVTNLAKNTKIAVKMAIDDMNMSALMGGKGVVFHYGRDTIKKKEKSMDNMYSYVKTVIDNSDPLSFFILETPAGTGTQLCTTLEEMYEFYDGFEDKYKMRIRFCIDTCHIFSAGYDISTKKGIKEYINKFIKLFTLDNLLLFHLNDSKTKCGSKKDRHEHITYGEIWNDENKDNNKDNNKNSNKSLKWLVKFATKNGIPMILETPTTAKTKEDKLIVKQRRKREIEIITSF